MKKQTKQAIRSLERVLSLFGEDPHNSTTSVRITHRLGDLTKQARKWESSYENTGSMQLDFSCDFVDPAVLDCDGLVDPVASFWVSIEIDGTTFGDNVYVSIETFFNYLKDNDPVEPTWLNSEYVKPVLEMLDDEVRKCFLHKWIVESSVLASWDH
ncbi:MAG: hypothetical protein Unbinned4294contig1001_12 [Prokaryotic dsDNA virus sp.]|nr:MAG: hypothetical protein Unbinned4294contig1001_12 [Prokaryotic dsDNA virus sp.]|tara:strand:- start:46 stop:513 length:468 start_codon:yes stop_codon:yes gene_type:complete